MPSRTFISKTYPPSFSEDGPPDESISRFEVGDLEKRIESWSNDMQGGISSGRMVKSVKLNAVKSTALSLNGDYLTGTSLWQVTDNLSLSGREITATTTGGISRGILGADITIGPSASDTALNIAAYFESKLGITASTSTDTVTFKATSSSHPIGGMVSVNETGGFNPTPAVPNLSRVLPIFHFVSAGEHSKYRRDDYIRALSRTTSSLLAGRMKVLGVSAPFNSIIVDKFSPGMLGDESLMAEEDTPIPGRIPASGGGSNWVLAKSSSPGPVWEESSLGPNLKRVSSSSIYLRTENDMTADFWVW
tara:strand:+ start:1016 stop:1933 length:918 start_codon:yes stop_codon:yes gene_type:complete